MPDQSINRREFLAAGVATAASASWLPALAFQSTRPATSQVVQVSSEHAIRGRRVHPDIVDEMLGGALRRVTGAKSTAAAWRTLLKPDDMIGLKFNRSGAIGMGTSEKFADLVIESLLSAGFESRQIVAIEISDVVRRNHGILAPTRGWNTAKIDFGSGSDRFADLLDQVTAIINIPFLKSHNIAGVTCSLKNLSHALVKHPAQYHGNGCAPFIGDIYAVPAIRDKVKLHLVNGLRVVFDRGPEVRDAYTWDAGIIFAGLDPVAVDAMGLRIINTQRSIYGLEKIGQLGKAAYLAAASARGLGHAKRHEIDLVHIRL